MGMGRTERGGREDDDETTIKREKDRGGKGAASSKLRPSHDSTSIPSKKLVIQHENIYPNIYWRLINEYSSVTLARRKKSCCSLGIAQNVGSGRGTARYNENPYTVDTHMGKGGGRMPARKRKGY